MSPEEKISTVLAVLLAGCTVQLWGMRFRFFTKGAHVPNSFEFYAIEETGIYTLERSNVMKRNGRFIFDSVNPFPFRMNDFLNLICELEETFRNRSWALFGKDAFLEPPAEFDPDKGKYLPPEPHREAS